ncbi:MULTISPECIES: hypothetical protein [unclassified Streptomyces]|uniref:hypothetical protein n=1 Tax=unclassified Streptomyces TaxID=2593676 RepID=UPI00114CEFD1|nr:hypothetical protein [Streptomyces sp. MnatMP-M77]MYT82497.1 hypothetical protein [Streptomyces sp. SID8364]
MDAQRVLSKADEIEAARQAARKEAIGPLAAVLAERKRLEAALAETEAPYRKAYAKAEAADWSGAELGQLGAEAPEPPRRARGKQTGARRPAARAEVPSQAPVNA